VTAPPAPALRPLLQPFVEAGVLTDADVRLADRLGRLGDDTDPVVLLGVALAFRAPRYGHVCVDLRGVAHHVALEPRPGPAPGEDAIEPDLATLPWPDPATWERQLRDSPLVRGAAAGQTPLVLEHGKLYLDRYWTYERRLAESLHARAVEPADDVDPAALRGWLDQLFAPPDPAPPRSEELDRQRLAAALAVLRRLTVIAGGPGTGKTYTVTRILALLHLQARSKGPDRPLRVALAAPTGKAAARLQESLREGLAVLDLGADLRAALERTPAFTLHRLLGTRRDNASRFRHDAANPLPHDVVIVDEASMVSLPLMSKLADAVAPGSRLILLGDRDQLASVEAGAAFGDICGAGGSGPGLSFSARAIAELETALGETVAPPAVPADAPGIQDAIVRLDRYRRFGEDSALARLAAAIQGDGTGALDLLLAARTDDDADEGVRLLAPELDGSAREASEDLVVDAYARFARLAVAGADPLEVFDALGRLRVLCAVRRGPDGAWAWNAAIEARLAREVAGFRPNPSWYVGRPVLVTENDYGVRLYNGDVGVVLADPQDPGRRVAAFPATDGSVRMLSPARLPACETTFAMTIHKSQGSQFAHAVVVLPRVSSPVLTRELLYTAITRASHRTTLLASEPILREALGRPIQRASGLQARLWPDGP
jgi:exodeoxyribonuclease V alpha subunit